ncbi:uncharacterized protein KIAA1755 homolog [Misgurnus anguillicaudatus]|uniref:uncharacterized protein KIAA1755 homolog n=1 Tax=Misgurnus anguillicaudatus TaxID=75329 RepID=UPI003CCFAAA4
MNYFQRCFCEMDLSDTEVSCALAEMNPDLLDVSMQGALYSPFDVTPPTVLPQIFQVIYGCYHGDALRCLTDFLIPARHLLESVRQTACALNS